MSKRFARALALATLALAGCAALLVSPAAAAYGLEKFEVTYANQDGTQATQAGSHPFQMTTSVYFNTLDPLHPDGEVKDFSAEQIVGLVGDQTAMPRCQTVDFLTFTNGGPASQCPDSTAVGTASTKAPPVNENYSPVFNLEPPPGVAAKLGFIAVNTPIMIEVGLKDRYPYNLTATVTNTPQTLGVLSSIITLWGNPADPAHDPFRGICVSNVNQSGPLVIEPDYPNPSSYGECHTNVPPVPLLTMPRACQGPLATTYKTDSWQNPGLFAEGPASNPLTITGCAKLGFSPSIEAQPTTKAASSPSGLDFSLDVHDEGLTSPNGLAHSDIEKTVVTLPEGFSTNPSLAEGLSVCTQADLARETAFSAPGAGCPNASKIGTVEVQTPLLDEQINGSLFIAKPYENPFGSLLALYMVIKNPTLGIVVRQPLKVESDPVTGQLTTVAEDLPQLPFSHFRLHFREGTRSPLASPSACGTYEAKAVLTPYAGGPSVSTTSTFEIITGPGGGPCPKGGLPPFRPELLAGTINNRAGSFSPFNVRLSRTDSEQEFTNFSIKLPPGITAKLAGVPFCPDAAIAAAKARTGPHGGQEELDSPSCPAASEIGRSLAGSGVGPSLAYAPGKIYLAGPYKDSALSIAAITAARVGPFDLGTVVVRFALKVDPETAEVFIDATGSDPIPHIIQGIPVHLRDIRAYNDRPQFVLNPTSCERTSTASTLLGSGLDFGSTVDDNPITVTTPFQAADCAALPFKPKLSFKLVGGTRRGAHPSLRAHLKMNGIGEAAIAHAQVTLPRSEFIENAHFNTICTRTQFKAGPGNGEMCPAGSIYGYAKAVTPILEAPLEGPVFLRSSEHKLPDVVASLRNGKINVHLVGKVDSVKGQLRNTFEVVPDAPVSTFDLTLLGGKKGLFVNSTNLCRGKHRALAEFTAHNGKVFNSRPELRATKCAKKRKAGKRNRRAAPRSQRAAR
jgi:hypothetical protein